MFSTEFLITSLVVILIPGTGVIYTVSAGLFLGWRASIAAAFGCTAGIVPHLTASILGLSAILHMSALSRLLNLPALFICSILPGQCGVKQVHLNLIRLAPKMACGKSQREVS